MKLYTYFRSSAAYRVRIALNLKGLDYEAIPVHLVRGGGEHLHAPYRDINPAALLPAFDDEGGVLTQSLAILEYLEETQPRVPLLPADALGRARVRALAQTVACDIHPLGNLRVLKYLAQTLQVDAEAKLAWQQHWMEQGFAAFESLLARARPAGPFCHGELPTLADCCLVPQVFNALRFGVDMGRYPALMAVHAACAELPAFIAAHPGMQPDAE
jgi:maleylacetoacetate isomerase